MTGKRGTQRILAIAALCVFGAIGSANATLIGDTVNFESTVGSLFGIDVVAGVREFDRFNDAAPINCIDTPALPICTALVVSFIDLEASSILFEVSEASISDDFVFTGINTLITSILPTFIPVPPMGGTPFTADVVLLQGNAVSVDRIRTPPGSPPGCEDTNPATCSSVSAATISLALTFQQQPPGVPEPSTLLLLGAGLVGLWARRRRN